MPSIYNAQPYVNTLFYHILDLETEIMADYFLITMIDYSYITVGIWPAGKIYH